MYSVPFATSRAKHKLDMQLNTAIDAVLNGWASGGVTPGQRLRLRMGQRLRMRHDGVEQEFRITGTRVEQGAVVLEFESVPVLDHLEINLVI